jgi:uncharacterized protein (DUF983 family)
MPKSCPHCGAEVPRSAFLKPRLGSSSACVNCGTGLRFEGPLPFVLEIAWLVAAFGIYSLIEGNLLEATVAVPVAIVVTFLQYRFGRIRARSATT